MGRAANKANRLIQIEQLLLAHPEGLSKAEIASRLGVHRATIYRDLDDLGERFFIYVEDDGRISIDRSRSLVHVQFTLHEALAVHLAARLLATRMDRQNPHAAAALRKLGLALTDLAPRISDHLQQSADVMDDAAQRHDPAYLAVLEALTLAWAEKRMARIWHRSERTRRVHEYLLGPYFIEPYAVGQTTYVIGLCRPQNVQRTFKIERIERAELTREPYEIPAGFDPRALLEDAWGIWYTGAEPVTVVLKFHPRVAARVRETRWHRSEELHEQEDGSLLWRARVAEPQEMIPWIRGWGADVEVLEPDALRQALQREVRRLAGVYQIAPLEPQPVRYYAHSRPGEDETRWQLLRDHLTATADLAAQLGHAAGVSSLAQVAALLHDIGKYSQAFQNRLRGSKRTVDHATAGAREIVRIFPGSPLAELLSYCIAGHHSGLPDFGDLSDPEDASTLLARREKKKLEDYSAYRAEIDTGGLTLQPLTHLRPHPKHWKFTASFLTRMVFSTLVDADWLETETYMEGRTKPRGEYPALDALLERFNGYIQRYAHPERPIDIKRSETLHTCIEKAALPPGLFTLTVPTGGGKTLASMAFALNHAVRHGMQRIIYVIPYTSIIEQNAAVFKEALGEECVLEHHSNFDWEQVKNAGTDDETNQTEEKLKLASENWEIPVVVTTNVQFFESLFAHKKKRARKVHNMAKSVIIFDEAQMLPREYLKPCMLAVWELVHNYGASAVFCTATQPNLDPFFPGDTMTELAASPQELYDFYRRVRVRSAGPLTDEDLAKRLNAHTQALCVVNTRRHARGLFDLLEPEGRFHLSTLMCPAHRQQTLAEIRRRLEAGEVCRLVSTQVIEAGVNLDFPIGFRALAGLDSIIQAAGRVNREGKLSLGELVVFEPQTELIKRLPPVIAQTARAGASVLRDHHKDPTSIPAIRAYFQLLDTLQDPQRQTDVRSILACLDKEHIDFATAGENFRLIDAPTVPVIIPYDAHAKALINELQYSHYLIGILRKLQRFTVNVYEWDLKGLLSKGVLDICHDTYYILTQPEYYDRHTGLLLPDAAAGEAIFFD